MRLFLKWYIDNLCPKTKARPFYFRTRMKSSVRFPVIGKEFLQAEVS